MSETLAPRIGFSATVVMGKKRKCHFSFLLFRYFFFQKDVMRSFMACVKWGKIE